jgi:hypothetical protein
VFSTPTIPAGFLLSKGDTMKKCSIPNCEGLRHAMGVCMVHYMNWWRYNMFILPKNFKRRSPGKGTITRGYCYIRKYAEHKIVVEKVLGFKLVHPHVVHHIDENRSNNKNGNLVVCQDRKYHKMLHNRMNSIKNGYPAYYRKCGFCHDYDDPVNLFLCGRSHRHKKCAQEYDRKRKLRNKSL